MVVVRLKGKLLGNVEKFDNKKFEIYMSTHGVLVIRDRYTRSIKKVFNNEEWSSAEEV